MGPKYLEACVQEWLVVLYDSFCLLESCVNTVDNERAAEACGDQPAVCYMVWQLLT